MTNNILDQDLKYTGPRTCPECGHQFPLGRFVRRYVMSFGLSKWPCQGCRTVIKCDFIKLQVYWLLGLVPFGFLFGYLMTYVDIGVFNLLYVTPFFAFVLATFYYVKFEKQE